MGALWGGGDFARGLSGNRLRSFEGRCFKGRLKAVDYDLCAANGVKQVMARRVGMRMVFPIQVQPAGLPTPGFLGEKLMNQGNSEYFEMQAERFAPRERHQCMETLQKTLRLGPFAAFWC